MRAVELKKVLPCPDTPEECTSAPVPSSLENEEEEEEDAVEWMTRWKKSKMCAEFRSSRHLFLPPAPVPGLCGLPEVDAGINDLDFSGLPESLKLALGVLEDADIPVPELF